MLDVYAGVSFNTPEVFVTCQACQKLFTSLQVLKLHHKEYHQEKNSKLKDSVDFKNKNHNNKECCRVALNSQNSPIVANDMDDMDVDNNNNNSIDNNEKNDKENDGVFEIRKCMTNKGKKKVFGNNDGDYMDMDDNDINIDNNDKNNNDNVDMDDNDVNIDNNDKNNNDNMDMDDNKVNISNKDQNNNDNVNVDDDTEESIDPDLISVYEMIEDPDWLLRIDEREVAVIVKKNDNNTVFYCPLCPMYGCDEQLVLQHRNMHPNFDDYNRYK